MKHYRPSDFRDADDPYPDPIPPSPKPVKHPNWLPYALIGGLILFCLTLVAIAAVVYAVVG